MSYNNYPRGCRFSNKLSKVMVPVSLDELVIAGTRSQRRWALRELQKINKKASTIKLPERAA